MKRALLWLCSLACLTIAGLYAYAWFNRDPLAVAFEKIELGMSAETVERILGQPSELRVCFSLRDEPGDQWQGEKCVFQVQYENGFVVHKGTICCRRTLTEEICDWVFDLMASWRPQSQCYQPAPPPNPLPRGCIADGLPTEDHP